MRRVSATACAARRARSASCASPSTRAQSPTTHSRPTVTAPDSTQRSPSAEPAPTVSSPPRASSRAPSPIATSSPTTRRAPRAARNSTPRPSRTPAPSWTRGRGRARQARRHDARGGTTASAPTVSMGAKSSRTSGIGNRTISSGANLPTPEGMAEVRKKKKKRRKRCHKVKRTRIVNGRRKVVKVRKCRPRRRKKPVLAPAGTHPPATVVAPPATGAPPRADVAAALAAHDDRLADRRLRRHVRPAQAERLAWRAGCGPRPGQVEALAALDLEAAVMHFTRPSGEAPLDGPEPTIDGQPLDVYETWYGDTLYWFDRLVRSRHQLVERLALVFHDWWATSNDAVGSSEFMLEQTNVFRTHGLGSFADMVRAVTSGKAMLVFLDGISNRRNAINENYGRELMELFTLGADRGAYTETDVRELAKSLSGWRRRLGRRRRLGELPLGRGQPLGPDVKTVFGQSGRFTWEDACRLVVTHPLHPSFFVAKLWSYFIPEPPSRRRRRQARGRLSRLGLPDPADRRGDPLLARVLRGPAHDQAARRVHRRDAARPRAADRRRALGLAHRRRRPAPLLPARRLGLGRQALAGHEHGPRALGHRQRGHARPEHHVGDVGRLPGRERRRSGRQGARVLARPGAHRRDGRLAARLRGDLRYPRPRTRACARSARTRCAS